MKIILILFLLLITIVAVPRIIDSQTDEYALRPDLESSEPQGGGFANADSHLSIGEIINNPSPYINEKVAFQGKIIKNITNQIFSFEQKDSNSHSKIIVVSKEPLKLDEGQYINLRGEIQRFYYVELNKYQKIELDSNLHLEYEGKPFIMADEIKELPGNPESVFYYAPLKPFF